MKKKKKKVGKLPLWLKVEKKQERRLYREAMKVASASKKTSGWNEDRIARFLMKQAEEAKQIGFKMYKTKRN